MLKLHSLLLNCYISVDRDPSENCPTIFRQALSLPQVLINPRQTISLYNFFPSCQMHLASLSIQRLASVVASMVTHRQARAHGNHQETLKDIPALILN